MNLVDCSCQPGVPYADGSMPAFYDDAGKAKFAYSKMKKRGGFYGIHLNGQHLVGTP